MSALTDHILGDVTEVDAFLLQRGTTAPGSRIELCGSGIAQIRLIRLFTGTPQRNNMQGSLNRITINKYLFCISQIFPSKLEKLIQKANNFYVSQ